MKKKPTIKLPEGCKFVKASKARQCWPQTPKQAMATGGGMYGEKPYSELPYAKRLDYVIEAIGEICGNPPSFEDKITLLHFLQEAIENLEEGEEQDLHGAAWKFFELGRRVERRCAVAFDGFVKRTLEQKKIARNAQQVRTAKQTEAALRLREFIRTEYKKHTPEVLSKEITKGAAYKRIRKAFSVFRKEEMQGDDYDIEDDVLEERKTISDSTIRRALAPLK